MCPLVYHRIFLTQIEIFRFIGIYFVCENPLRKRKIPRVTLMRNCVHIKAMTRHCLPWNRRRLACLESAAVAVLILLSFSPVFSQTNDCRIEAVEYKGWQAQQLSNRWVQLVVVPQNGGRLMQVTFAGHPYLFVNPKLAGKYFPPSSSQWFNYGGDKLWLLPEGNDDEQHWAGNSDILDDGPFTFRKVSEGRHCEIELMGPSDPQTGIQISRTIGIDADSPRITFHASMKNITGHTLEWSMQSVSQYDTSASPAAAPQQTPRVNPDFRTYAPANPSSSYLNRYHVRYGPAENPEVSIREDGLFTVHYAHMAAELWLDSEDGWIAVVDGTSHYAMVERFQYEENKTYPGRASVIFWTNGPAPRLNEARELVMSSDPDASPYYLEAELNSPMCRLRPGETCAFETDWFPTRSGNEFHGVTEAGILIRPLKATPKDNGKIGLSASFGLFFSGHLVAHLYDEHGHIAATTPIADANPIEATSIETEVAAPGKCSRLSIHLVDESGVDRGALQEIQLENRDDR